LSSLWSSFFSQKETFITYNWSEVQAANPDTIFSLSLAKEKLSELPIQLWKFKNLKALNLQRNRFETLPDSLEQLTEIEFLDISHNRFAVFPLPITRLYKLKVLKASSNKLNYISNNIENCEKLEEIDLYDNLASDIKNINIDEKVDFELSTDLLKSRLVVFCKKLKPPSSKWCWICAVGIMNIDALKVLSP
jgi:Leucine-rich repeat (LRR) protein